MKEAEAPSDIKTIENPVTKNTEDRPALLRTLPDCAPFWSSSRDMPDKKEMYAGTSGSTQGDRKERIPATKARPKEILSMDPSLSG